MSQDLPPSRLPGLNSSQFQKRTSSTEQSRASSHGAAAFHHSLSQGVQSSVGNEGMNAASQTSHNPEPWFQYPQSSLFQSAPNALPGLAASSSFPPPMPDFAQFRDLPQKMATQPSRQRTRWHELQALRQDASYSAPQLQGPVQRPPEPMSEREDGEVSDFDTLNALSKPTSKRKPAGSELISLGYLANQRATAKTFILAWHQSGYTYEQLLEENLDATILRGIYQELGIDSTSTNNQRRNADDTKVSSLAQPETVERGIPPLAGKQSQLTATFDASWATAKANTSSSNPIHGRVGTQILTSTVLPVEVKGAPAAQTTTVPTTGCDTVSVQQLPAKSQAPAVNRQDYVARLMAAKTHKSTSQTGSSAGVQSLLPGSSPESRLSTFSNSPNSAALPLAVMTTRTSSTAATTGDASSDVPVPRATGSVEDKRKARNDLARLRMQALESARIAAVAKPSSVTASGSNALREPSQPGQPHPAIAQSQLSSSPEASQGLNATPSQRESPPTSRMSECGLSPDMTNSTSSIALKSLLSRPPPSLESLSVKTASAKLLPTGPSSTISRIPGLFMTSPLPSSETLTPETNVVPMTDAVAPEPISAHVDLVQLRKRPVATDFGYGPSSTSIKRPFGHSRDAHFHEDLVIEASDDETAESDMQDELSNSTASVRLKSERFSSKDAIKLNHLERIEAQSGVSLTSSVPPSPQSQQRLQLQESQINEMKKRIAEMEMKRKAKIRESGAITPVTLQGQKKQACPHPEGLEKPILVGPRQSATLPAKALGVAANSSSHVQDDFSETSNIMPGKTINEVKIASYAVSHVLVPPLERGNTTLAARQPSKSPSVESPDWKHKRLTEIRAGSRSKLDTMKAQMIELQAAIRKEEEDKNRLIQELESHGIDTEGMPHAELQSTKNELMAKIKANSDVLPDATTTPSYPRSATSSMSISDPEDGPPNGLIAGQKAVVEISSYFSDQNDSDSDEMTESTDTSVQAAGLGSGVPLIPTQQDDRAALPRNPVSAVDLDDGHGSESGEIASPTEEVRSTSSQNEEHRQVLVPSADASGVDHNSGGLQRLHIGNAPYAVTETELRAFFSGCNVRTVTIPTHKKTQQSCGYAFVEIAGATDARRAVAELNGKNLRDRQVTVQQARNRGQQASDQSSAAAPSEAHRIVTAGPIGVIPLPVDITTGIVSFRSSTLSESSSQSASVNNTPELRLEPSEPSPEYQSSNQRTDGLASSPDSDRSDEVDKYEPPEDQPANTDALTADDDVSMRSDSDYEPPDTVAPLQTQEAEHVDQALQIQRPVLPTFAERQEDSPTIRQFMVASDTSNNVPTSLAGTVPPQDLFTPYQSALASFKSYRNHPDFASTVSGGLKSSTYSHKIDAEKPICPYEAAGGICNDSWCQEQHFRSMAIGDEDILQQIGTFNPGRSDEEKQEYAKGLRDIVIDLRQKNIQDSELVASEIFAYRRRFLNDPSRVLNL